MSPRRARAAAKALAALVAVTAVAIYLSWTYGKCGLEALTAQFEPVYNRVLSLSSSDDPSGWRYFSYPPGRRCGAPSPTEVLTINASGQVVVLQGTGMFDDERGIRYRHRRAGLAVFETIKLHGFIAVVAEGGNKCEIASRIREMHSDLSGGGFDKYDRIPRTDPQLTYFRPWTFYRLVYQHPADDGTVYRTVIDYGLPGRLAYWIERGESPGTGWARIGGNIVGKSAKPESIALRAFHPINPKILYAECKFGDGQPDYFLMSSDKGEHFEITGRDDEFKVLAISRSQPEIQYRVREQKALERTDQGSREGWKSVGADWMFLPFNIRGTTVKSEVKYVAVHPQNPALVLVSCTRGLLRSEDAGRSWQLLNLGIPNADTIYQVVFDLKDMELAYVATAHGLFVSHDKGLTWRRVNLAEKIGEEAFKRLIPVVPKR